jgi:soluble lytic murein transglycosylase-like protein
LNVQFNLWHKSAYGIAAAALLGFTAQVHAAERLMLANGFDLVCDHHALVQGRVRVYPKAAAEDYVELSPDAIRGVETVPDPPTEPAVAQTESASQAPASKPAATPVDARLTAADLHQLLAKAGSEHNVDEDLLASVVKAESGGNAHAVSHAGARGLMQLMPGTAQQLGVSNSFAPDQNVRGGTAYLDELLRRYHDNIVLALAAYNAGPEAVDRYRGIPPYHETRLYVARVIHEFNRRVMARQRQSNQNLASIVSR